MHDAKERRAPVLGIVAIATSTALVCVTTWITGPGVASFNAFNASVFGRFYTAGAIAMVLFYGLAFVLVAGSAVIASVAAWMTKESPRWVTWGAIIASLVAPVVAVNLLRGA
ncbi:MAG: hypothetical protein K2Y51_15690 [Gammaproteobacteria bacterium]|nr:hypothetical protein [Gammaproteobacteria bacterium]